MYGNWYTHSFEYPGSAVVDMGSATREIKLSANTTFKLNTKNITRFRLLGITNSDTI